MKYNKFITSGGEVFPKDMYLVKECSITTINYSKENK